MTVGGGPPLRRGLPRRPERELVAGRRQSDRRASGPTGRRRRSAPVTLHPVELRRRGSAPTRSRGCRPRSPRRRPTRRCLTQADSIAWLFNIRGGDIAHNPVALAFAILPASGKPALFIDGRKLSNAVRAALADLADVARADATSPRARRARRAQGARCCSIRRRTRRGDRRARSATPAARSSRAPTRSCCRKARKNATELAGARRAHIRDGAAMVRFLAWLDRDGADAARSTRSPRRRSSREFRAETARARRLGAGRPVLRHDLRRRAERRDRPLPRRRRRPTGGSTPGALYLIDSGAQYRDGTTDITRTVADRRADARRCATASPACSRATSRSPRRAFRWARPARSSTRWRALALWQAGLDYDHGTGHGVGSFLSVHEGPARISKLGTRAARAGHDPLQRARLLQDRRLRHPHREPASWCTPPETIAGGERPMLGFETLTLAPIDRRLIEPALLTPDEIALARRLSRAACPAGSGHLLDAGERGVGWRRRNAADSADSHAGTWRRDRGFSRKSPRIRPCKRQAPLLASALEEGIDDSKENVHAQDASDGDRSCGAHRLPGPGRRTPTAPATDGPRRMPTLRRRPPRRQPPATAPKFLGQQDPNEILASNLIGSTVYDPSNNDLGKVNDVILAEDGKVDAIVIGVGGFLGIGQKNVAVQFSAVQETTDQNGSASSSSSTAPRTSSTRPRHTLPWRC